MFLLNGFDKIESILFTGRFHFRLYDKPQRWKFFGFWKPLLINGWKLHTFSFLDWSDKLSILLWKFREQFYR